MERPIAFVGFHDRRDEEFREITYPGVIPGRYEISNYGRVYSRNKGIYMKYFIDKDGYHRLGLTTPDHPKRWKNYSIHKLVSHEFVYNEDPDNNIITNHADGTKDNNYHLNLEYCTDMQNRQHAVNNNLMSTGEDNYMNVFSEEFIHEVCGHIAEGKTAVEVCNVYGYKHGKDNVQLYDLARNIINKATWRHISKQYGL